MTELDMASYTLTMKLQSAAENLEYIVLLSLQNVFTLKTHNLYLTEIYTSAQLEKKILESRSSPTGIVVFRYEVIHYNREENF